jgi:hypothetical protein
MAAFTVVWHPDLEEMLAEIWLHSLDRQPVRAAADRIDRILQSAPPKTRVPTSAVLFELWQSPLHILYSINEPDCLVRVLAVEIDSLN